MASKLTNKTRNCNNPFLEDDGYCTKCGGNHFSVHFGQITFHEESVPDVNSGYEAPFGGAGLNGMIGMGGTVSDPDADFSDPELDDDPKAAEKKLVEAMEKEITTGPAARLVEVMTKIRNS